MRKEGRQQTTSRIELVRKSDLVKGTEALKMMPQSIYQTNNDNGLGSCNFYIDSIVCLPVTRVPACASGCTTSRFCCRLHTVPK